MTRESFMLTSLRFKRSGFCGFRSIRSQSSASIRECPELRFLDRSARLRPISRGVQNFATQPAEIAPQSSSCRYDE
jgi:hypothetical protein